MICTLILLAACSEATDQGEITEAEQLLNLQRARLDGHEFECVDAEPIDYDACLSGFTTKNAAYDERTWNAAGSYCIQHTVGLQLSYVEAVDLLGCEGHAFGDAVIGPPEMFNDDLVKGVSDAN